VAPFVYFTATIFGGISPLSLWPVSGWCFLAAAGLHWRLTTVSSEGIDADRA
jgi:hypothetical protein